MKKSHNLVMWSIKKEQTNDVPSRNKNNIKWKNRKQHNWRSYWNCQSRQYFLSVGSSYQHFQPSGQPTVAPLENSMFLTQVNVREFYKIIRNLKNSRSFGMDEFPPMLIKKSAQELATPITRLIIIFLPKVFFQTSWKSLL